MCRELCATCFKGCLILGVPSTFMVFFVAGRVVLWYAVHVFGCFCGRECGFVVCRPRLGVFLWTEVWFCGVSSTFLAVLVAGRVEAEVYK